MATTKIDADGRGCTRCHQYKEWRFFGFSSRGPNGRQSHCRECDNKRQRTYKDLGLAKYGLTELEYLVMLRKQNGVCLFCQQPPNGRRLDTDHCHASGKVRGLLCNNCNKALGLLKDDPEIILRAYNHLISFSKSPK